MPSQSRQQYRTIEVQPEGSKKPSSLAPSSPGSPGKSVRWANESIIKTTPRQPTTVEQWSFYNFECHARQCGACYNPLDVHRNGRQLCGTGYSLAQDIAQHVYRQDGVVYSCIEEDYKLVKVQMPHDYDQTAQVLRALERKARKTNRPKPIISYAPTPVRHPEDKYDYERQEVILEPARTPRRSDSKGKKAVVLDDGDVERQSAPTVVATRERRGSLYYKDLERRRKEDYTVEVRQPGRRRQEYYGDAY